MGSDKIIYMIICALLTVNAYFIKGLVGTITDLRIQVVKLVTENTLISKLTASHAEDIRTLREKSHDHGNRLATSELNTIKIEVLEEKINDIRLQLASK